LNKRQKKKLSKKFGFKKYSSFVMKNQWLWFSGVSKPTTIFFSRLVLDNLLYGGNIVKINEDGSLERLDPLTTILNESED
jgi:hypothetical protein